VTVTILDVPSVVISTLLTEGWQLEGTVDAKEAA